MRSMSLRRSSSLCRSGECSLRRRPSVLLSSVGAVGAVLLLGVATGCGPATSALVTVPLSSPAPGVVTSRGESFQPSASAAETLPMSGSSAVNVPESLSATTTSTVVGVVPALRFTVLRDFGLVSYGDVLAHARLLVVKGRAPKTGYKRSQYGRSWDDNNSAPMGHNGCRTREDILRRDLVNVTVRPGTEGCVVESGTLLDPYTGEIVQFQRGERTSSLVQIDHVVALADSWVKGAQYWPFEKRLAFANDPHNLLAVSGWVNSRKGASDTATWLPPNKAYRCEYVARQVEVKRLYGLWVTEAEQTAMMRVLQKCSIPNLTK